MDHVGLTAVDDFLVSGTSATASRPNIASSSGDVFFGWADSREGATSDIYSSSISGAFPELNISESSGSAFNHAIAARSTISLAFAWQDTRNGSNQIFYRTASREPLLFIPGIGGSELQHNTTKLWPTISPADIRSLNRRTGLTGVVATDIIRIGTVNTFFGPRSQDIYATMIARLTTHGGGYAEFKLEGDPSRLISDYMLTHQYDTVTDPVPTLFAFPYDWRLSNVTHMTTLRQYITHIRQLHGGAKVNILAHSMGGLLLRRYILEYGPDDIDHVVTVGSPFWGAPKAIDSMLSGNFFDDLRDWWLHEPMRETLATLAGAHELLPSDYYLQNGGSPVMSENGWDINNRNGAIETYTSMEFKALIDQKSGPDVPSQNNALFHTFLSGRQDNWSADDGSIKWLHICGYTTKNETTLKVVARGVSTPLANTDLYVRPWFEKRTGAGDGTVPLLSAQRLSQFLAPGTMTQLIVGAKDRVGHNELMRNSTVFAMTEAFLKNSAVPPAPLPVVTQALAPGTVSTQLIMITGVGYVHMVDSLGNDNVKLSDIAAQKIPGVVIDYGGSERWVDIRADSDVELTIQGIASDPPFDIKVLQLAEDGTPLSLRHYQFAPNRHSWQAHISPSSNPSAVDPIISVDTNNNGMYETSEQILPSHSSGTGVVDATAPVLNMNLSVIGNSVVVTLAALDDTSPNPSIRYTVNGGPIQNYIGPLSFAAGNNVSVKAFAEDAMGNTSGLISTAVLPRLSMSRSATDAILLEWPESDAFVLEETDNLLGAWSPSPAPIALSARIDSATVPIGSASQRFFRLKSFGVTTGMLPDISITRANGDAIVLQWPESGSYVLEETSDLLAPWATSSAPITRSAFTESATVPIGSATQKFFRLRSQTVTK